MVHAYTYDSAGRLSADTVTSIGWTGLVDDSVLRIGTTYDDLGVTGSNWGQSLNSGSNWE